MIFALGLLAASLGEPCFSGDAESPNLCSPGDIYVQVINVRADDMLNMRASSKANAAVVGRIRPDTVNIVARECRTPDGVIPAISWRQKIVDGRKPSSTWCEVHLGDKFGWVNAHYISPGPQSNNFITHYAQVWQVEMHDYPTTALPPPASTREHPGEDLEAGKVKQESDWGRFDSWYLRDYADMVDQVGLYALVGGRDDPEAIIEMKTGWVWEAAALAHGHADWTAEDVLLELQQAYLFDGIEPAMVRYIHGLGISERQARDRARHLDRKVASCESEIENMRPTQRPDDPTSHCRDQLAPARLASAGGGAEDKPREKGQGRPEYAQEKSEIILNEGPGDKPGVWWDGIGCQCLRDADGNIVSQ